MDISQSIRLLYTNSLILDKLVLTLQIWIHSVTTLTVLRCLTWLIYTKFFLKKSHNAEKLKRKPLGIFKHPFCRKTPKKLFGTFWGFFSKKCRTMPKKIKGGPFSLARYCMLREKKKNLITIHMPQKWNLSSSVKCIFRKTRTNRILVKQSSVFIVNFDAQCNQKLRILVIERN